SSVFLYSSRHPHDLHSFPTRRSSDLASISQRQCFAINAWSTCRFASKQVVIAGITPFQFIGFLALLHIALARCWGWFRDSEVLRSEEHTSELQSRFDLVCRLLLEKKK